jgi:hypothetical protein
MLYGVQHMNPNTSIVMQSFYSILASKLPTNEEAVLHEGSAMTNSSSNVTNIDESMKYGCLGLLTLSNYSDKETYNTFLRYYILLLKDILLSDKYNSNNNSNSNKMLSRSFYESLLFLYKYGNIIDNEIINDFNMIMNACNNSTSNNNIQFISKERNNNYINKIQRKLINHINDSNIISKTNNSKNNSNNNVSVYNNNNDNNTSNTVSDVNTTTHNNNNNNNTSSNSNNSSDGDNSSDSSISNNDTTTTTTLPVSKSISTSTIQHGIDCDIMLTLNNSIDNNNTKQYINIELDGNSYTSKSNLRYFHYRDNYLKDYNINVIRIRNDENIFSMIDYLNIRLKELGYEVKSK